MQGSFDIEKPRNKRTRPRSAPSKGVVRGKGERAARKQARAAKRSGGDE